jgi:hypothetical protein
MTRRQCFKRRAVGVPVMQHGHYDSKDEQGTRFGSGVAARRWWTGALTSGAAVDGFGAGCGVGEDTTDGQQLP